MSDTQQTTPPQPTSLRQKFARAVIGTSGLALAFSAPAYAFYTKNFSNMDMNLLGACMGTGSFLFASTLPDSARNLKDCFTKARTVIPNLILGGALASLCVLVGNEVTKIDAQWQVHRKEATPIQPDEMVSETAAQRFCSKNSKSYETIVIVDGQKRLLLCP